MPCCRYNAGNEGWRSMESSRTGFHSGSGQGAASSPRVEVRRARIEGASCGSATFTGEWRVHLAAIHECRTHRDPTSVRLVRYRLEFYHRLSETRFPLEISSRSRRSGLAQGTTRMALTHCSWPQPAATLPSAPFCQGRSKPRPVGRGKSRPVVGQ